jgi:hypothetical protein
MTADKCPSCQADDVKTLGTSSVFQFGRDRLCNRCGTTWRPACPRWGAWTASVAGGIVLIMWLGCVVFFLTFLSTRHEWLIFGIPVERDLHSRLLFCAWVTIYCSPVWVVGISIFIYGVRVICGKAGGVEILHPGSREATSRGVSTAPQAVSQTQRTSEVKRYHIAVALILPFVGLPWGLLCLMREKARVGLTLMGLSLVPIIIFVLIMTVWFK